MSTTMLVGIGIFAIVVIFVIWYNAREDKDDVTRTRLDEDDLKPYYKSEGSPKKEYSSPKHAKRGSDSRRDTDDTTMMGAVLASSCSSSSKSSCSSGSSHSSGGSHSSCGGSSSCGGGGGCGA